ncbi:hypothetical protein GKA63_24695 [Vibrio parahaemolyticus]|nr:hypothetical protein [Vibrio parahaemolyticus]EGQ8887008.1 hypothetical protein [Vibrio parahaemolyticus]EGQ8917858.1 hypothetical protein [Vibrio parahaemolyticus]EGQ8937563.1 hypothetical protein [Vibrio parahaemolyticus]
MQIVSQAYNAALRGEQRDATPLKPLCHKHKSYTLTQNCQALRIPLERFVMRLAHDNEL